MMSLSVYQTKNNDPSSTYFGMYNAQMQNQERVTRNGCLIDPSVKGNRLYENEDGVVENIPKTQGEVLGELVVRPLLDTGYAVANRVFAIVTNGFSHFDKFVSKIIMLPVVGATPQASSEDSDSMSLFSIPSSFPKDVIVQTINEERNYEWVHSPDFKNPTQGYSNKVFRIVIGSPTNYNGRAYTPHLVHHDPARYKHTFREYIPQQWAHDDSNKLSYPTGEVTVFDPDFIDQATGEKKGGHVFVTHLTIVASSQVHVKEEVLETTGRVKWQMDGTCLKAYQKFQTKSFWKRPDGTTHSQSITPQANEMPINEIEHLHTKSYIDYSHQVVKLAVNDPFTIGYKLIQAEYEVTNVPYNHKVRYKLLENDDAKRECIREETTFIVPQGGCPFFGTHVKELVIKVEKVQGVYLYRGEKDIAYRFSPWKTIRHYYSRCVDELNSFESEELEYTSKLPDSKTKLKGEL